MRTLIVYATNSSGTQEAAQSVRAVLTDAGHEVELKRAYHVEPAELAQYDLVVLGSCTWDNWVGKQRLEGQLHEHMRALIERVPAGSLRDRRIAVFALGDSSYNKFCGAADILEEAVRAHGAQQIGTTLRIDGYYFALDANRARVAEWAGTLARNA